MSLCHRMTPPVRHPISTTSSSCTAFKFREADWFTSVIVATIAFKFSQSRGSSCRRFGFTLRRPPAVQNAADPEATSTVRAEPSSTSPSRPIPQQKYLFVADGANDKVWIIDRKTGTTVGSIGDNGRMAGQFHFIDGVATDSKGNVYTGEVETGKRVQKFVPVNNGRR